MLSRVVSGGSIYLPKTDHKATDRRRCHHHIVLVSIRSTYINLFRETKGQYPELIAESQPYHFVSSWGVHYQSQQGRVITTLSFVTNFEWEKLNAKATQTEVEDKKFSDRFLIGKHPNILLLRSRKLNARLKQTHTSSLFA